MTTPLNETAFTEQLQQVGTDYYHDKHPYHQKMNAGELTVEQIQLWVANRFYYQKNLPVKDALILSRCPIREIRKSWIQRILDHDGWQDDPGGIEKWLRLASGVGLAREDLENDRYLLPGVRFAVDAYVNFVATRSWLEGIASSLTELFAPKLMAVRLRAFEERYPWIDRESLSYFRNRLTQAPRDSDHGLSVVLKYCTTYEQQLAAVASVRFKCQLLWAQLDALHHHDNPAEVNQP